jgi:hypothetical protein
MRKIALVVLSCASLLITQLAGAADIPWASSPEEVGMSSERLQQINIVIQRHIDAGDIQGAVTAVARRGKLVHFQAHGLLASSTAPGVSLRSLVVERSTSHAQFSTARQS